MLLNAGITPQGNAHHDWIVGAVDTTLTLMGRLAQDFDAVNPGDVITTGDMADALNSAMQAAIRVTLASGRKPD